MMQELLMKLKFSNHRRFSALGGIPPHEGVRAGEEHYRSCAESHFAVLQDTILKDGNPVLIIEDDIEAEIPMTVMEVPDDADCVYLGTSHGGMNYKATIVSQQLSRIEGVLATHAILYLNREYAEKTIEIGKKWIYEQNRPFDVGMAFELQPISKVYALRAPLFYQSDAKNAVNKWERITRTPLLVDARSA